MIGFFNRLVTHQHLPPLPDDDPDIEARWPRFKFVGEPDSVIRHMQRKCLMRCEHMRAHPELCSHIERFHERRMARSHIPNPTAGTVIPIAPEPFDFTGIEVTAPVSHRRQQGDS